MILTIEKPISHKIKVNMPVEDEDTNKNGSNMETASRGHDLAEADKTVARTHRFEKSLHNEYENKAFSVCCASVETICEKSRSHPSFVVYFTFIKKYMVFTLIVTLISTAALAYCLTNDFYSNGDIM